MRSPLAFAAAIAFLLALPVAATCEALAPDGGGQIAIHLVFSLGAALLVPATFDFRTPRWIAWTGSASALFLAVTFLLQGLSTWTKDEWLTDLAYQDLGQGWESFAGSLIYAWCIAVLVSDSRGASRMVGVVALALAVATRGYAYYLSLLGRSLSEEVPTLQVLALLPFIWLLLEGRKARGACQLPKFI